jgi:hypothetical protein
MVAAAIYMHADCLKSPKPISCRCRPLKKLEKENIWIFILNIQKTLEFLFTVASTEKYHGVMKI